MLGLVISSSTIETLPVELNLFFIQSYLLTLSYTVMLDSLTYIFMLLTSLLIPLCVISSWNNIKINLKEFLLTLIIVEWVLLNMFSTGDFLFFYV